MTRTGKVSESRAHDPRADDRLHEDQPNIALANAEEFATNRRDGSVHRLAVPGDSGLAHTRTVARDAWQGHTMWRPGPVPSWPQPGLVLGSHCVQRGRRAAVE